ncbi:hypothetical protein [Ferruginibacter sp.]
MKKLMIIFIIAALSTGSLCAQNRTIYGRVISERLDTIFGVHIIINGSIEVGSTDLKGFFRIEVPDSVKKLLFRGVGYEPTIITPADNCSEIELVIMSGGYYDFKTLKQVDKLRMKKLKKIPEIHQQAFAKGLFKTDKACYTQEIILYNKKK